MPCSRTFFGAPHAGMERRLCEMPFHINCLPRTLVWLPLCMADGCPYSDRIRRCRCLRHRPAATTARRCSPPSSHFGRHERAATEAACMTEWRQVPEPPDARESNCRLSAAVLRMPLRPRVRIGNESTQGIDSSIMEYPPNAKDAPPRCGGRLPIRPGLLPWRPDFALVGRRRPA